VGSRRRQGRVDWSGLATLALVPIAAGVVYAVAFGGAGTALSLLTTTQRMNAFATNEYLRLYHDGPWFTFFVHALLLAPLFTLTFLALCGWYAARRPGGEAELLLLVFIGAGIATFACLPHNPRYSNPLDVLMRVFAGAAIASIAAAARSRAIRRACVGAVAVLAAADVYAFHQLWVDNRIYDPTSATLVAARRLVPSVPPAVTLTAAEYVSLSLAYYRAHDYEATIAMSRRALAIGGETAEAYNNIGAAYCELGRWNDAIPALETALRLRPGFQLARNNLAWARSEVGR
jgi:tetratricopeptide (TPR) repeat protein